MTAQMHYENHKTVVENLEERISTIRLSLDYDKKISERDELQELMNEADFWNNPDAAQKTINSFKLIKAQVDPQGLFQCQKCVGFKGPVRDQ